MSDLIYMAVEVTNIQKDHILYGKAYSMRREPERDPWEISTFKAL